MTSRRELRARLVTTAQPPPEARGRPPVPLRFAEFNALEWIERADLPHGIGPDDALRRMRTVPREAKTGDDWQCHAAFRLARRRWRRARREWGTGERLRRPGDGGLNSP